MDKKELFFVVGAGRSGTTALARILDTAENAAVTMEATPRMCIAARDKYNNVLPYPHEYIRKTLEYKMKNYVPDVPIYGDKNPNYIFFIEELYRVFQCKFIFVFRDGRDVVRSAMDFDRFRTPNYYRYEDDPQSNLTEPEEDFWDYARLRPLSSSPEFKDWKGYSKFEKFCWLWANYNKLLIEKSKKIPANSYLFLNITTAALKELKGVFDFLGLQPFDRVTVERLLHSKINAARNADSPFPRWQEWDENLMGIFRKHSNPMMKALGFL